MSFGREKPDPARLDRTRIRCHPELTAEIGSTSAKLRRREPIRLCTRPSKFGHVSTSGRALQNQSNVTGS